MLEAKQTSTNSKGGTQINVQGNFRIKSEAQPTENRPRVVDWLTLVPTAWVICFLRRPGWTSTEIPVCGHDW